jgi:hypothetical protein
MALWPCFGDGGYIMDDNNEIILDLSMID